MANSLEQEQHEKELCMLSSAGADGGVGEDGGEGAHCPSHRHRYDHVQVVEEDDKIREGEEDHVTVSSTAVPSSSTSRPFVDGSRYRPRGARVADAMVGEQHLKPQSQPTQQPLVPHVPALAAAALAPGTKVRNLDARYLRCRIPGTKWSFSFGPLDRLWMLVFIDMLAVGLVIPLLPYYASNLGADAQVYGYLGSVYGIAQLVGSPLSM